MQYRRRFAVRVPEARRLTGIGRSKLYELIAAGEIRIIKVGSITLIPWPASNNFSSSEAPDCPIRGARARITQPPRERRVSGRSLMSAMGGNRTLRLIAYGYCKSTSRQKQFGVTLCSKLTRLTSRVGLQTRGPLRFRLATRRHANRTLNWQIDTGVWSEA
jgi:excisionase family DNA binding protein